MPLNDPRLICPACGKLVEVEVERFEDMFEEPPGPDDEIAPAFHATCIPRSREEAREFRERHLPHSTSRVYSYRPPDLGPLADDE